MHVVPSREAMATALPGSAPCGSLPPAELRKLLQQTLPSDADLDAFCLDYFPQVYERFSDGMDRLRKVNLLLTIAELGELTMRLQPRDMMCPAMAGSTTNGPAAGGLAAARYRGDKAGRIAICLLLIGLLGANAGMRITRTQPVHPAPEPLNSVLAAPIHIHNGESTSRLTSEPTGAYIINPATGTLLGKTPWSAPWTSAWTAQRLCIYYPGYAPVGISPERWAVSQPVHLKLSPLKGDNVDTEHISNSESCDAYTPIIQ